MRVFSLYDVKSECYLPVMCQETRGQAIRQISDVISDGRTQVSRYPEDFKLYELGEFDNKSGELKAMVPPAFVVSVVDIADQLKAGRSEKNVA